jgi:hypothetical protein
MTESKTAGRHPEERPLGRVSKDGHKRLGLSMSHDIIVKQHGGIIDVETAAAHEYLVAQRGHRIGHRRCPFFGDEADLVRLLADVAL